MAKERIQLTVITAVYNGEDYIEDTINSVLKFAKDINFQYVVVNDGSTDDTSQILNSFGDKIEVIHQSNAGESTAVNVGIENAKGDC